MYIYVRSRELEGTFPGSASTGTWCISALRIHRGWGVPKESDWPYDGDASHWPPSEPVDIDQLAKLNRILAYRRVTTLHECIRALAANVPSIIAVKINDQWNSPGKSVIDRLDLPTTGTHTVFLVGYDDSLRKLSFQNSWGAIWGDKGYGAISYEYFNKYQLEAWIMILGKLPQEPPRAHIAENVWGTFDKLGVMIHCVELADTINDERIGWVLALERDGFLDIEDLFVKPAYRGKRHGSRLAFAIRNVAQALSLPIRVWVSHADMGQVSQPAVSKLLKSLGVALRRSSVPWAAFMGEAKP